MALPRLLVMIELAVIAVALAVIWDATLVALADVKHQRQRIDRRWRR